MPRSDTVQSAVMLSAADAGKVFAAESFEVGTWLFPPPRGSRIPDWHSVNSAQELGDRRWQVPEGIAASPEEALHAPTLCPDPLPFLLSLAGRGNPSSGAGGTNRLPEGQDPSKQGPASNFQCFCRDSCQMGVTPT